MSVCARLEFELLKCQASPHFPPAPRLDPNAVHTWWTALHPNSSAAAQFERLLSPEELARAHRFHSPRDSASFVIARGMLRTVLAAYTGLDPVKIDFVYSEKGKPALSSGVNSTDLRFNVSHTDGLLLIGMTRARSLGVDVEKIRYDFDTDNIAERFFSPAEQVALRKLPFEVRHHAFFSCWTRKEAYIKAIGEGLSLPLHQFDVALDPSGPAALLATRPDPAEASRWLIQALPLGSQYAAALAVEVL